MRSKFLSSLIALSLTAGLVATPISKVYANQNNINKMYSEAYEATIYSLKEGTQDSIKIAREKIAKLPKELYWAIGEFSKQVDSVQQPIFEKIIDFLEVSKKSQKQEDINKCKQLIISLLEDQYKCTWSAELDKVQQQKIDKVVELMKGIEKEGKFCDNYSVLKEQMSDLSQIKFNDEIKLWVDKYENTISNKVKEVITKDLTEEQQKIIEKFTTKKELTDFLASSKLEDKTFYSFIDYWMFLNEDKNNSSLNDIKDNINKEINTKKEEIKKEKEKEEEQHHNTPIPTPIPQPIPVPSPKPTPVPSPKPIPQEKDKDKEKEKPTKPVELTEEEKNEQLAKKVHSELTLPEVVKEDLKLPISKNSCTLYWKSFNPDFIKSNGKIVKDSNGEKIKILVTVIKGDFKILKEFYVIVEKPQVVVPNPEKEKPVIDDTTIEKPSQKEDTIVTNPVDPSQKEDKTDDITVTPSQKDNEKEEIPSQKEETPSPKEDVSKPEKEDKEEPSTEQKDKEQSNNEDSKKEELPCINTQEELNTQIAEAVKNLQTKVSFEISNDDLNVNDYQTIITKLGHEDFGKPQLKSRFYTKGEKSYMDLEFEYSKPVDQLKTEKEETEKEADTILKSIIKDSMSTVEKELAIHDYLVKSADYKNTSSIDDHNAYGVLVKKQGVCESYAKAFNLLSNKAGIETKLVTGVGKTSTGTTPHAWNIVKLYGSWYNVDVTWDDPVSDKGTEQSLQDLMPIIHTYFNVNDEVFGKDHIRGDFEQNNYPKCDSQKYSFDNLNIKEYTSNGTEIIKVSSKDELDKIVLNAIENKQKTIVINSSKLGMDFDQLKEVVKEVATKNKKSGFSWKTSLSGNYLTYELIFK